jgi:hypothetical protein
MKPCPTCKEDKAKLRTGSLGEPKGVWCTACGRSTDSVEAWESAWREGERLVWEGSRIPTWNRDDAPAVGPFKYAAPHYLDVASGDELDKLASHFYGIHRQDGETDGALRARLIGADIT